MTEIEALIFGAGACVAGLALLLLVITISAQLDARAAQRRELELAGLKASHTDPKREIVV